MKKYILSVLLMLTASYAYACEDPDRREWSPENYNSDIYTIKGPYSVDQIEKKHTYTPAGQTESIPFGTSNKKWIKFKKTINPGDQFYNIYSEFGDDSSEKYIVVRNKCIVGKYRLSTGKTPMH